MPLDGPTDQALPDHWRWPNFGPAELRCKHTGALIMVPSFLDRLQQLRSLLGFPFPIASGYRHTSHPAERGKASGGGAHTRGRAVDIRVYGIRAMAIVERARALGFTGIGVSQSLGADQANRFIHLDDMTEADGYHAPRPAFWSY